MILNNLRAELKIKDKLIRIWLNFLYILPKKMGRKLLYYSSTKKKLNLKNPQDLNEKINWLMVYKYGPNEGKLSDKYLVKEIIKNMNIEGLKIPKTYKTYQNANEIDINELPDKFVLKCNHACGNVFICTDKKKFNLNEAKQKLNKELKRNYAQVYLEYHYKYITPLIIAEEYLDDSKHKLPVDYKFHCLNGKVDSILYCSNRENELKLDYYDVNWNPLNYTYDEYKAHKTFEKPENLNKMIEISEKLSKSHDFVRVDLYSINNKIYFGELTFTPMNGILYYLNKNTLDSMGSKLKLTK